MSAPSLPQQHCRNITDHPAHNWDGTKGPHQSLVRCPGRHTPANYRAPHAEPSQPDDPFAGIDED